MKYFSKAFLLIFIISCFFSVAFAQDKNSKNMIKAKAKILNISKSGGKKKKRFIATVQYKINAGSIIRTKIDILALPYYGTLSKVGDTIDVYYNKNNPAQAYSRIGKFVEQYGLIILILLGVIISGWRIFKVYSKPKTT